MEYVPCIGNSSYSFWWILLKLYRCFKDGLEICILFFQNPEIIFYHFFRIFNLDIFRALILQICTVQVAGRFEGTRTCKMRDDASKGLILLAKPTRDTRKLLASPS